MMFVPGRVSLKEEELNLVKLGAYRKVTHRMPVKIPLAHMQSRLRSRQRCLGLTMR